DHEQGVESDQSAPFLRSSGSLMEINNAVACGVLLYGVMNGIENTTDDRFNMTKGVLGALLGAGLGVGVMFAFYAFAGFRFPLLGIGIGVLTGFFAKMLFKGTDTTLGFVSAGIAL